MRIVSTLADQIKVNLFTLSFPRDLEEAFFEDHFRRSLRHVRLALLLGIFFYGIFGILDAWLVPGVKEKLWLIRYAILLPFIFSVFLFSFSSHFKRYMNLSISSVILLAGVGIIAMILIAPYPGNYSYYAGLILVFIYGYTFFKLRFIWATLVGWVIVIAYEIAAVWVSQTPIPVLINNNFFFLTGNILGMFACYSIELYSRKNFLQARLLENEREKVNAANSELEKKVEERTVQLTKANKELKQEIAERKRAEESLERERETFFSMLQKAPFGVVLIDKDGRYLYVNTEFTSITGYTLEDIPTGRDWFRLAYPDRQYRRKVIELWRQDFSQRGIGRVFRVVCKDGGIKDIEFRPTLLDDGKVIVTSSDITERKRVEEALRRSEENYRTIFDAANDAIFVHDADTGQIIDINQKMCEMYGYTAEEARQLTLGGRNSPYSQENALQLIRKAAEGEPQLFEWMAKDKGGRNFWVEVNLKHAVVGGKNRLLAVVRDITERKRAEADIKQSLDRLKRALNETVNALAKAAEIRDPYTAGHQERVTRLACAIAEEMRCSDDQIEGIRVAGILHDIGKISVPAEILSKPGPVPEMEFSLVKTHSQVGYDILKTIDFPWPVAQIVLQHHERMDGSGYPSRLSGEDILLEARILAVADVVEALASHRPYRPALGTEKALEEISGNRGVLYDGDVVDACLKLFTERGFRFEEETEETKLFSQNPAVSDFFPTEMNRDKKMD